MTSLKLLAVASATVILTAGSAAAGPWEGIPPNRHCCYFVFYDGSGGAGACATTSWDATEEVYAKLAAYGYSIEDLIGEGEMICYAPGDRPVGLGGGPIGAGQFN